MHTRIAKRRHWVLFICDLVCIWHDLNRLIWLVVLMCLFSFFLFCSVQFFAPLFCIRAYEMNRTWTCINREFCKLTLPLFQNYILQNVWMRCDLSKRPKRMTERVSATRVFRVIERQTVIWKGKLFPAIYSQNARALHDWHFQRECIKTLQCDWSRWTSACIVQPAIVIVTHVKESSS